MNRKHFFLLIIFITFSLCVIAQPATPLPEEIETLTNDKRMSKKWFGPTYKSAPRPYGEKAKVIIVPYDMKMYQAEGDYYICQTSSYSKAQLNDVFRRSLESNLMYSLDKYFDASCFRNDQQKLNEDYHNDLSLMYRTLQYTTEQEHLKEYFPNVPELKWYKSILQRKAKRYGTNCLTKDGNSPELSKRLYINVEVGNDSVFHTLVERRGADYVVLINQLEVKTRFSNCMSMATSIYQRDFYVHYTVLDKLGKQVDGGVVATTYESGTNNAQRIVEDNIGNLCRMIINSMSRAIPVEMQI